MTLLSGTSEADIDAPVQRCWAVVEDVARWPEWQQGLESVTVLERDDAQRPLICDTVTDAKLTKLRARVRVTYDPPHRVVFARVQSDQVDELEGSWELSETAGSGTHAIFRLAVDPGHVGLMARPLERALRPIVVGHRAEELGREVAARG